MGNGFISIPMKVHKHDLEVRSIFARPKCIGLIITSKLSILTYAKTKEEKKIQGKARFWVLAAELLGLRIIP